MRRLVAFVLSTLDGAVDHHWPTSDDQPFADFINSVDKVVVSSTPLTPSAWEAERVAGPLPHVVASLRERPGDGDIGVHGSIRLVQSLLAADLLDELQLVLAPVVDPVGRRLFDGVPELRRMALVSATPSESGSTWMVLRRA